MEALDKFTTVWYTFGPLLRITVSMVFSNKSFMCLQLIVVINNQKTEFERHFWLSLSQKLNAKSLYIKAKHKSIALCRLLTFSQFALKDKLRNPCPGYPNDERSACDLIIRQKKFSESKKKVKYQLFCDICQHIYRPNFITFIGPTVDNHSISEGGRSLLK